MQQSPCLVQNRYPRRHSACFASFSRQPIPNTGFQYFLAYGVSYRHIRGPARPQHHHRDYTTRHDHTKHQRHDYAGRARTFSYSQFITTPTSQRTTTTALSYHYTSSAECRWWSWSAPAHPTWLPTPPWPTSIRSNVLSKHSKHPNQRCSFISQQPQQQEYRREAACRRI